MFCRSWQAGYLQRGLGIPPAGGMGRWKDGKGVEGGGGLHVSLVSCPFVKHGCYLVE